MKPPNLTANPLELDVQSLPGIQEKRAAVLMAVGIENIGDLLDFRPRRYLDRSATKPIRELLPDEDVTVIGEILSSSLVRRGKPRLILRIADESGIMEAVWFAQAAMFSRILQKGQVVAFSGTVKRYKFWQMIHPDFDILSEKQEQIHTGQLIPLYPSGQEMKQVGLSGHTLRRIINGALKRYTTGIPETLPLELIRKYRLLGRQAAYQQMHFPQSSAQLDQVWRRFKYEELFYLQLLIALRRKFNASPANGLAISVGDEDFRKMLGILPFQLTGAQQRVLGEIRSDMQSGRPMSRLVQGDVGSGKTAVALLAMLMAQNNGYQAALMAPTEILAQQHFFSISNFLASAGIRTGLLLGSMKAKEKRARQEEIAAGEIDLVIGTHALIQDQVRFRRLGLAIVDEQHRFGVMQRAELIEKGEAAHVLVMTATPIPRTLALTIYGDLDVSIIDELPPGRQEIQTHWRQHPRLPLVYDFLKKRLDAGEQAYIVYPLVEESEKIDLKAATEAYHQLQNETFPDMEVALLHGRMKMQEKEAVMRDFKAGNTQLLVSTTVIEVGVDVPNTTVMMIEHAERFGLSQLHQLRGRVGRGTQKSYCILMTPAEINDTAQERMLAMEKTNDGFVIAEEDLRLRGSGEFFGTRQHGLPDLKYTDLVTDRNIVVTARKDAFELVEEDPHLRASEHAGVRQHFKRRFLDKFHLPNIG